MNLRVLLCLFSITAVAGGPPLLSQSKTPEEEPPKLSFDSQGRLLLPDPELYRSWVYVGTPLTPNELNPPEAAFPEFHNVYIHPGDYAHYRTHGTFRDGTVLIKELVTVGSKAAVSGQGYFMGEFTGLEATIKDSKRFPDEPGHWAYFSFGHSYPLAKAAAAFPTAACNICHDVSAADDFVFTQYYPVLRAAKASHTPSAAGSMAASHPPSPQAEQAKGVTQDDPQPGVGTESAGSAIPTGQDELFAYLQSGVYKEFAASESKNHPTTGPHTKLGWPVRVYVNQALDQSMKAGNTSHPVGSGSVKEMYNADGNLQGWAVMLKTQADSAGGKGWFWYEVTSTTDGSSPVAIGNGVPLCFSCHSLGKDYMITRYPLK